MLTRWPVLGKFIGFTTTWGEGKGPNKLLIDAIHLPTPTYDILAALS